MQFVIATLLPMVFSGQTFSETHVLVRTPTGTEFQHGGDLLVAEMIPVGKGDHVAIPTQNGVQELAVDFGCRVLDQAGVFQGGDTDESVLKEMGYLH